MKTMDIELKPCPFCGGKAFFANRFTLGKRCRTVVCESCHAVITNFEGEGKEKAAELWNTRFLIDYNVSFETWISVEDAMPENNEIVLCLTKEIPRRVLILSYLKCRNQLGTYTPDFFSHWMHMPGLPKED